MTPAEFKTAVPVFANEPPETIQRHIDTAIVFPFMGAASWGTMYAIALQLCTAHLIVTEKEDLQDGPAARAGDVTSATRESTAGRASKARGNDAVMAEMENWLKRSKYGQRLVWFMKTYGIDPGTTGGTGTGRPRMESSTSRGYSVRGDLPATNGGFQGD